MIRRERFAPDRARKRRQEQFITFKKLRLLWTPAIPRAIVRPTAHGSDAMRWLDSVMDDVA